MLTPCSYHIGSKLDAINYDDFLRSHHSAYGRTFYDFINDDFKSKKQADRLLAMVYV